MQKLDIGSLEAAPLDERVVKRFKRFQWLQLQHDREYHADIFNLTPAEKLTHFVLHLNKYGSKLMELVREAPDDAEKGIDYQNILTDYGVIITSMANVFSLKLGEYTADRLSDEIERFGDEAISIGFYRKKFGGATPTHSALIHATVSLMSAAGEAADVMIQHARLEGNTRVKMTNLIHVIWESFHVATHCMAYFHEAIRCKHFDEHIADRLEFIETRNPNYMNRPKYAEDFAPVA